ncbi:DUF3782 domain-containing protein [Leptolyngbya sp. PCC 6406]|uniref:DUF3782 domain-containing protein n=1 Tax=Leptolyngbya sp. PCC 6406 TaxID=1173264 RepID=UPI0002AC9B4F|nr:DUF3782 domain-containing protein [Leptolyngbya sp. PCC 6406]
MATTADDVWRLLGELATAQQETERRFQETERRFQETERRFQETDRRFQETERRFQETDRQIQQVSQQIGKLGNRLGEFVEWQVRPAVLRLFQERGIAVHELFPGVSIQRDNEGFEIDLLVINSTEAVLVEVKSKLAPTDVDEHLERLAKFKRLMPRYGDVQAMGAVAGMVVPPDVARYAYRRGLFVLAPSGETVTILNDEEFQPRRW